MKTIRLTNGLDAIVDDDDYPRLAGYVWSFIKAPNTWYATRREGDCRILMHREILVADAVQLVDHKDGNGLNNRRDNLRICSHSENLRNQQNRRVRGTSRFRGVSLDKRRSNKKWRAYLTIDYKYISLGMFSTEEEAARAYDVAAKEKYGGFGVLNFPALNTGDG